MLDGSRRIAAMAIKGITKAKAYLVIEREELPSFLHPAFMEKIRSLQQGISWFPDYQTIPELGIHGERSTNRYSLLDLSPIRDKTIADFGCNIGQACLEYYYHGAREVYGFDVQKPVVDIANEISRELGIADKVKFHCIDFNDPGFMKTIDMIHPSTFDFCSFFSVYRTKELTQREKLFEYIIRKTGRTLFFEGHADNTIDTLEYYHELFTEFGLQEEFLGYSEGHIRPLFTTTKKTN